MLPSFAEERDLLIEAVMAAGQLAVAYVVGETKVWTKGNDSPVSEADIAVDAFLAETLRAARPDYGWLSEETADDGSRLVARRSFVIDPIDGTRAFIAGGTDWTIPIAVVEEGRPIAAALIAPRRGELYQATLGGGATMNGAPIRASDRARLDGGTLAVSRRMMRWGEGVEPVRARNQFFASLAYRLARVADGRLDAVVIRADAKDWDLAAADLLVHEAGGLLCDLEGNVPRYDRTETGHPPLVACPRSLSNEVLELTRSAVQAGAVQALPD